MLLVLAGAVCAATPQYFTSTIAGTVPSTADPVASEQYFTSVNAVAYDSHGILYYANQGQIWRLNADGTDTLIAGSSHTVAAGNNGTTDGTALGTVFSDIGAIALDAVGNLYVADSQIWKVTPDQKVSVLLPANNQYFGFAASLATDAAGNLYVEGNNILKGACCGGSIIVKYSASAQTWSTVLTDPSNYNGAIAASDSALYFITFPTSSPVTQINLETGTTSQPFPDLPPGLGVAVGTDGTVYIATDSTIYAGNPQTGVTQPFAGIGAEGYSGDGGLATQASIGLTSLGPGMAVNPVTGDVAFTDTYNFVIRTVSASTHKIQTIAGQPHFAGDNGPAALARFDSSSLTFATALASDSAGNIYLSDQHNFRIRKVTPSGIITTVSGNGIRGNSGDGGKATEASINTRLGGIALDQDGNLYFVSGATIRMVDVNGIIHTVAGGGSAPITNGAPATGVALLPTVTPTDAVYCVATDASGNLYIGLGVGSVGKILKVSSGNISFVAGNNLPNAAPSPDGVPAATAQIGFVNSIAFDKSGLVYFTQNNGIIRMVNAQGNLATFAGVRGAFTTSPLTAGPAKNAALNSPSALGFDSASNLYFSNSGVNGPQVAVIDPSGNLTPIAGNVPSGLIYETSGGDGGNSLQAGFASIVGMTLDPSGNVYVLDSGYYIRRLSPYVPSSPPPYLDAGGVIGSGGSVPPIHAVSGNGDASVFGGNFGATHTLELVNGKISTNLGGVCVSFGGTPAAILAVYSSQINVQVPTLAPGPVTVEVTLNCGTPAAIASNVGGVMMQGASPEFFTFLADPVAGNNPIAAINPITGVQIGPPGLLPGLSFAPAKVGSIVEAYGTGWGSTIPSFGLGVIPGAAGKLASPFTLTFGGAPVDASDILYAGASPCCAGLYQVDFKVPSGTPSGNQPLIITVGSYASPPRAFIAVQ